MIERVSEIVVSESSSASPVIGSRGSEDRAKNLVFFCGFEQDREEHSILLGVGGRLTPQQRVKAQSYLSSIAFVEIARHRDQGVDHGCPEVYGGDATVTQHGLEQGIHSA